MGSMECEKNVAIMNKDEACSYALSIATGSTLFMVLKAVIELDVLEIINRVGPGAHLSPVQIAAQLPTTNLDATANMLDRLLRLLASNSIISYSLRTCPDGRIERLYGPSLVTEFLTKSQGFGAMLLLGQDKVCADSWYHLKDAVLDGSIAFDKAHGMNIFEYQGTDPRFNKVFNNAMSAHSTIIMEKLLENYKGFEGITTLIDVGGGIGVTLNMIISKYTRINGVNFDLPHVIKNAPAYNGVEHIAGDMFVEVPTGDAIFMKWICHDWSDKYCLKLLNNCYMALPDHGKVILCDYILPVAPETTNVAKVVSSLDLKMMVNLVRGKERTEIEFEALAKGAGFEDFKVVCSAYELKVMELLKKK